MTVIELTSFFFLFQIRNNKDFKPKFQTSRPLEFDGPYDLIIPGTQPKPSFTSTTTEQPVYDNFPQGNPPPEINHESCMNKDLEGAICFSPDDKHISVVYAKPQKKSGKDLLNTPEDGGLYCVSPTTGTQGRVGWDDKAALMPSFSGESDTVQTDGGNDTEGWEDNALYAVNEGQRDATEWMDNAIYAGSDE